MPPELRFLIFQDPNKFWCNVQKTNSCWLWTGRRNIRKGGYGYIYAGCVFDARRKGNRRAINCYASRLSYVIHTGELLTSQQFVCHSCDNPPCVNPAHLFKGSHQDNMTDAARKGRLGKADRPDLRGENNWKSKLRPVDVLAIRGLYQLPMKKFILGKLFGVSTQSIAAIVEHRHWKHIPWPI